MLDAKDYRQLLPKQIAKLTVRWAGPFEVLKNHGNGVYELRLPIGSKGHPRFNVRLLKQYYPNNDAMFPHRPMA